MLLVPYYDSIVSAVKVIISADFAENADIIAACDGQAFLGSDFL